PGGRTPSRGGGAAARGARPRRPALRTTGAARAAGWYGSPSSFAPSELPDLLAGACDLQEEALQLPLVLRLLHRLPSCPQRLDLSLQLALPLAEPPQLGRVGGVRGRGRRARREE